LGGIRLGPCPSGITLKTLDLVVEEEINSAMFIKCVECSLNVVILGSIQNHNTHPKSKFKGENVD
jgi:hypothetical protein